MPGHQEISFVLKPTMDKNDLFRIQFYLSQSLIVIPALNSSILRGEV